jgi:hypothetical protein
MKIGTSLGVAAVFLQVLTRDKRTDVTFELNSLILYSPESHSSPERTICSLVGGMLLWFLYLISPACAVNLLNLLSSMEETVTRHLQDQGLQVA